MNQKAAAGLAAKQFDQRQQRYEAQGRRGETDIIRLLKRNLPNSCIVLNDVIIEPKPDVFTQIDHVAVGPPGLFIIETKAWKAPCSGYRDNWKRQSGKNWVRCDSPTEQNLYHADLIIEWLSSTGIKKMPIPAREWIIPVVVFTESPWVKTTDCSMLYVQNLRNLSHF